MKQLKAALLLFGFTSAGSFADNGIVDSVISKMNSFGSIRANITIDNTVNGQLSYKRPNLLHVKFSDGRVISANGRFLWIFSPENRIAGKQDLDQEKGTVGIASILKGYENVNVTGNIINLKSPSRYYEEVRIVTGDDNMPKAFQLKTKTGEYTNIALSNIQTDIGLPSNLFNFHPPSNAQIIENPLNQRE